MYDFRIFSHSIHCLFISLFLLLCRSFLVSCSHTCFCFCCLIQEITAKNNVREFSSYVFFIGIMFSGFKFKYLIHLSYFFFLTGLTQGDIFFFFCMWLSTFPSIIYSRDYFSMLSILSSFVKYQFTLYVGGSFLGS